MARLAVISLHTSPLAQPGSGDGGGMNVYVRELAAAEARRGGEVDVFTRRETPDAPRSVAVEPGVTVHHVDAGPAAPVAKESLPEHLEQFTAGVLQALEASPHCYDALHANYWLSGVAGHAIKHALDLPLIVTFHTVEKLKEPEAQARSPRRAETEEAIVACADAVLASCDVEAAQLRDALGAERIEVVPPGVDHAIFGPGDRAHARRALGIPADGPLLLFAGRLQALKGADLAIDTFEALRRRGGEHRLVVVGGPSGPDGVTFAASLRDRVRTDGLSDRVRFVEPQPHVLLSTYYRAADACLVPSLSESFGLVALEASACGVPVIASKVGGLSALVEDGVNGVSMEGRDATEWADAVEWATRDALRATRLSTGGVLRARSFTWGATARRLADVVASVRDSQLVSCA